MTDLEQLAYNLWDAFDDWDAIHNDMMETHTAEEIRAAQDKQAEVVRKAADAFWLEWDRRSKAK